MRLKVAISIFGILLVSTMIGLRLLNDTLPRILVSSHPFLAQIAPSPPKALFSVFPASGTFDTGESFTVALRVSTEQPITSVRMYLNFNSSVVSVEHIDTANSAFQIFWEETSNSNQIKIQASEPSPGFVGTDGLLATVTLKGVAGGTAGLTYHASSVALQADDTDILDIGESISGTYTIVTPASPPPPSPPPPTPASPAPSPSSAGGGGASSQSSSGTLSSLVAFGDYTGDNKINIFDLSVLLSRWKTSEARYDLNGDGIVNVFDLSIMLSNWTK